MVSKNDERLTDHAEETDRANLKAALQEKWVSTGISASGNIHPDDDHRWDITTTCSRNYFICTVYHKEVADNIVGYHNNGIDFMKKVLDGLAAVGIK